MTPPGSASSELQVSHALVIVLAVSAAVQLGVCLALPSRALGTDLPQAFHWAVVAFLAGVVTLGATGRLLRRTPLRWACALVALGYLGLIVARWPYADPTTPTVSGWFLTVPGSAVLAVVVAAGPRAGGATGAAAAVLWVLVTRGWGLERGAAIADAHTLTIALLVCTLGGALLRAGRDLDETGRRALEAAGRNAELLARAAARQQTRAFAHDRIFSLLTLAARGPHGLRQALAAEAWQVRRALDAIDAGPQTPVRLRDLADQVSATTLDADPAAGLRVTVSDPRSVVDERVAGALLGALHQALANSVHHAGPRAHRWVRLVAAEGGVTVVVSDDGRGFDPERVPGSRLGVAVSILGRMQTLPGGSARVDTAPGAGTSIVLRWSADAAADATSAGGHAADTRPSAPDLPWDAAPRALRLLCLALAAVQVAAVVLTRPWPGAPALGIAALVGLCLAMVAVGRRGRPPRWAAGAVCALVVIVAGVRDLDLHGGGSPVTYLWATNACAVVLLLLCLRGRPGAAMSTLGLVVLDAVLGVARTSGDHLLVVAATVRPIALVGLGLLIVVAIRRVQERTALVRAGRIGAAADARWRDALPAELRAANAELRALVVPLLDRIVTGVPLSSTEAEQCLVVEGRLRDGYRGGRLDAEPLRAAAAEARRRGVDVALVDDALERRLSLEQLTRALRWAAGRLEECAGGHATVRLLPGPGPELLTVSTPDGTTSFGGSNLVSGEA